MLWGAGDQLVVRASLVLGIWVQFGKVGLRLVGLKPLWRVRGVGVGFGLDTIGFMLRVGLVLSGGRVLGTVGFGCSPAGE